MNPFTKLFRTLFGRFFFKNIQGTELELSGKKYIVPPMNFKTIMAVTPLIKSLEGLNFGVIPSKPQLYAIAKIMHQTLRRNYPFIRLSTVINGLDMANMGTNLSVVMNGSGTVSKGEAKAGNQ